jgi:guanylate kinase
MIKRDFRKFCVIISGPSGCGKTTLCRKIAEKNREFFYSVSCTTRKPREDESNGRDYYFISREEFEEMVKQNKMLEYARVYEDYYGTPMDPVIKSLQEGKVVIMDIDFQGMRKVKKKMEDSVAIYILPPSIEELKKRIEKRKDSKENAFKRFREALKEMDFWTAYDYVIINKEIDKAVHEIETIINAEKLKRERMIIEREEE